MNNGEGITEVLLEFLEVVVHNVLYLRKLYPESIYVVKKKYGVPVYQAVHPEVVQYIRDCLKAVAFHSTKNQLKRLFICFEKDDIVLERFVIDVLTVRDVCESDAFLVNLETNLRDFMLRLHSSPIYLGKSASPETSFSIRLETTALSSLELNENPSYEDFPWIEQKQSQEFSENAVSIVPIHTIETDCLTLQVYVERP